VHLWLVHVHVECNANLPDDPAILKAMIAALQAENAKISADIAGPRPAWFRPSACGSQSAEAALRKSSGKDRAARSSSWNWPYEDLLLAVAEAMKRPIDEGQDEPAPDDPSCARRCATCPRARIATPRERVNLIRHHAALTVAAICACWRGCQRTAWT